MLDMKPRRISGEQWPLIPDTDLYLNHDPSVHLRGSQGLSAGHGRNSGAETRVHYQLRWASVIDSDFSRS